MLKKHPKCTPSRTPSPFLLRNSAQDSENFEMASKGKSQVYFMMLAMDVLVLANLSILSLKMLLCLLKNRHSLLC